MKIERTKNAARNIVVDSVLKLSNMLFPFIMRSVILHYLGVEYLGLNGLFRSILSFLNLAELGVGSAMVFSMYKPIAHDDTDTICALMKLYRTLYRLIGLFIAVAGLALTPFLETLVKGEVPPDASLYVLYFMNLGSTVLTYWLFAYKNCLLNAHQRNDVISGITLVVRVGEHALKILLLILFRNYYLYLVVQLVAQVVINLTTAWRVDKMYPNYSPRGNLPREKKLDIAKRVRDLFTSKFSYVISDSADTLVISSFLGLAVLAVYQNYFYVVSSLRAFLEVVLTACVAGIGNSLVTESMEKNYTDFRKLSVLFSWLTGVSSAMMLCMYQPFMRLWMGEENMLTINYVVCFVIYFYSLSMNKLVNTFKDAAGIWHKDRWRPLTAALVNLTLNLATVQWLGLYGVLLSTVVSIVLVQIPWLFHNLFQEVFPHQFLWEYVREFLGFVAAAAVACGASWLVCGLFTLSSSWVGLIANAAISFAVSNVIFLATYGRNALLREALVKIKSILLKK